MPTVSTVWYGMTAPPDTDLPMVSGLKAVGVVPGSQVSAGGRVPIRTTWIGTDATSIVRSYEYFVRTDLAPGVDEVRDNDVRTAGKDVWLIPNRRHRFTVRATDDAANVGPYARCRTSRVTRYDQASSAITYRGTWRNASSPGFWLGTAKYSSTAGASATLVVTARSIAFVSSRAPTRGAASIAS